MLDTIYFLFIYIHMLSIQATTSHCMVSGCPGTKTFNIPVRKLTHIAYHLSKMARQKEVFNGVEWKIRVADGSSETLVPEAGLASRLWLGVKNMIGGLVLKVWRFLEKAWDLGVDDPRKVIHCLKVGIALTVVSLFYYTRPLYEGVGGNAMWAIMTVVVVFENTVGKSLLLKRLDVIANIS